MELSDLTAQYVNNTGNPFVEVTHPGAGSPTLLNSNLHLTNTAAAYRALKKDGFVLSRDKGANSSMLSVGVAYRIREQLEQTDIPNPVVADMTITTAAGTDTAPAVGTCDGWFPVGSTIDVAVTHSAQGAESSTQVTVSNQTAEQIAAQIAVIVDGWAGINATASGTTVEFLADTALETLTLTTFAVS